MYSCTDPDFEKLGHELLDPKMREEYARPHNTYHPGLASRLFGGFLIGMGNIIYGEKPSYLKFRAIEVIARVPYHSWSSAAFTLLTAFYMDEARAMRLSKFSSFARLAKDNETMHVVVISCLAARERKAGIILHTLIPFLFAFFYFWVAYVMYLVSPKAALELNYLFEHHAYDQYARFLKLYEKELKEKTVNSDYLLWYGRDPKSQYDFFERVCNDELIHRNSSLHEIVEPGRGSRET